MKDDELKDPEITIVPMRFWKIYIFSSDQKTLGEYAFRNWHSQTFYENQ